MKTVTLRLPDDVYEVIRADAFQKRKSINAYLLEGITKKVRKIKKGGKDESKNN